MRLVELHFGEGICGQVLRAVPQALLHRHQTQQAAFASAPAVDFEGRYARVDRHALSLGASVSLQQTERLRVGLSAQTRLWGDSRADINGKLFLNWMF